ncbi:hypothetical protein FK178_02190 [Antarcticibacterium arcticum]|uniref:Uncharacterized protein n=1 Tax=Antarcticibacterium arcticum TaxID=2585771 RepID=A0A5B8YFR6_9FLAO|nr:hypothetical protein [Antarcticibacterium arcticum]QED36594.1 hypothetical protein FK178_02190 [Antarcticibacterium arcticum]
MNYVIKSQRDGWYFKEFQGTKGAAVFGKIQDARLYSCKADACKDMLLMGQYGQRVIALTRMCGKSIRKRRSSTGSGINK